MRLLMSSYFTYHIDSPSFLHFYRQSVAPSVVGSLNEKDEKAKKAKQPIVIWPEWTEQDIAQEKWVRVPHAVYLRCFC